VHNDGTGGETVRAFHMPSTGQRRGVPSQSWHASHVQWGEGKCDGFVTSTQQTQAEARVHYARHKKKMARRRLQPLGRSIPTVRWTLTACPRS
jgi:hypothetical protein